MDEIQQIINELSQETKFRHITQDQWNGARNYAEMYFFDSRAHYCGLYVSPPILTKENMLTSIHKALASSEISKGETE